MADGRTRKPRTGKVRHDRVVQRFAERLRAARTARGLSQAELARKAASAPPYIGRVERGEAAVGIDMAQRLADALEVPISDLVSDGSATPADFGKDARDHLDALLKAADPATVQMISLFLSSLRATVTRNR